MVRREFLSMLAAAAVVTPTGLAGARPTWPAYAPPEPRPSPAPDSGLPVTFPKGFLFGSATASYQVEGAWNVDGKEESIWDRFCHTPGRVRQGDTGDVACDQYHRYREDIGILKQLNQGSYRFSISWPRVQSTATGKPNPKGLDHYDRLTDALLEAGIRPLCTLYHWDLPQAVLEQGGWLNRDIAARYAAYVEIVAARLSDRIHHWAIFNEPWIFLYLGYASGSHPPGGHSFTDYLRAAHNANLAHAQAVAVLRSHGNGKNDIGSAYNMAPVNPATQRQADLDAAARYHATNNVYFLEAAQHGRYPAFMVNDQVLAAMGYRPGDDKLMQAPIDWIGINYYKRVMVRDGQHNAALDLPGADGFMATEGWLTGGGWEVWPEGLADIVSQITREYPGLPIEITENGCCYLDAPEPGVATPRVHDPRRIDYYRGHLRALGRAIQGGANVRAYHAWSLLDNLEWQDGYTQRFGLTYVDFPTSRRIVKDSGYWYGKVAATGVVEAGPHAAGA
jgi:beta-glucosidase